MAIPFLNHLDLRSVSELQNALLHKTTTATASNVEAKIIYDTGTNSLQYYNGTTWINLDGSGDIAGVTAGDYLNGGGTSGTVTLNHDATSRTDTTSTDAPGYGGTFEAVTSVTTNTYGHVTAIDVSTVTIPASDNTDTTYQLSVGAGTADTAVVKLDASSGTDTSLTVGVQDQALTISETTGVNGSITLGLNNSIEKTITFTEDINIEGELGMSSTIAMNSNYIQSLADPVNAQDAATKAYVDAANQGTVTGSGTANTIPKWSTGGTGIEDSSISDNGTTVTIGGNLDVQGTTTTIDSTTVAIGDNMMKYAKDNTANASDIGWYGKIVSSGTKYPGMWYDASTGISTPKFVLGIATTEPAGTGTIATAGTLVASLEGNADTATALWAARNFSITGDITAAPQNFNGQQNVILNASIDANVVGATELNVSGNGTSGYLLSSDGDGSFSWVAAGAAPSDATITLNPGDGLDGGGAFTLNQASNETITFSAENASTTNKGVVELATCAEVLTGTDGSRVVTPDTLACKSVTATISAASVSGTNLYAEITHSLGTEDVMVELFDASTKETVFALVERKDKSGTNSTTKVTIYFSAVPSNDIEVLITSLKGATAGTVAYS